MEKWQEEGTIGFFLPEAEPGWRTDNRRYDLPTLRVNRFRITLIKHEERSLEVSVSGLVELPVVLTAPLPDGSISLHVTILWRAGRMQLFFDAIPVATTTFPDMDAARRAASN